MKIKNLDNKLYLIAYSLLCILAIIGSSRLLFINNVIKILIYGIVVLIFLYLMYKNNLTLKNFIISFLLGIVSIYAYLKLGTVFLAFNILAMFSIKSINIKEIVKIDLLVKIIFLLIHIFFFCKDNILGVYSIDTMLYKGEFIRYSLYFSHPNLVSSIIFWGLIDIFYLKEKNSFKDYIIYTFFIVLTFLITKTRTLILLYMMLLFFMMCKKVMKKELFSNIISLLYKYIFEIFSFFSIICCFFYDYSFIHSTLNKLFSGRIYHSYTAFELVGFQFFPCDKLLNVTQLIIDNFYIRCITMYGCIYLLFLFLSTKINVKNDSSLKDKIIIIIFAVSLFTEYNAMIIGNAIPILLISNIIFNKIQEKSRVYTIKKYDEESLISIVIPIFNVDKYLRKCLDSVLKQTYKNLEIILVNDGSKDNSLSICREYQNKDKRIVVIDKKNEGVSSARNDGVKKSKGEYIIFIDADDWIDNDFVEVLYSKILEYKADICVSGCVNCSDITKQQYNNYFSFDKCLTKEVAIELLLREKMVGCCWGKIYKKDLIKNIRFDKKLRIAEDLKYLLECFEKADDILLVPVNKYNYYLRDGSAVRSGFNKKWYDELNLCKKVIDKYKDTELYDFAIMRFIRLNLTLILNFKLEYKVYQELRSNLEKYKNNYLFRCKKNTIKNKIKFLVVYFIYPIKYLFHRR